MPGGNFTFVATIPASGNNPSQDQPVMKDNNGATNSWVSQDHYGFNTGGPTNNFGGLHQQVTFPANNPPGGYTLPFLYTNNDAFNHPQLFLATTSAANSTNQYLLAANGSVLLMGGIILKWGVDAFASGQATRTIVFTNQFPNSIFYASYTIKDVVNPLSTTGVTDVAVNQFLCRRGTNTAGSPALYWMAIGN